MKRSAKSALLRAPGRNRVINEQNRSKFALKPLKALQAQHVGEWAAAVEMRLCGVATKRGPSSPATPIDLLRSQSPK